MRSLHRNERLVYYARRVGETTDRDEYGNETGETTPIYGDPIPLRCNISAATGVEVVQTFGNFTDYNRVICLSGTECPLDETCVVWFGASPTDPYNHIVVRKADTKNCVLYALREVRVT